MSTKTSLIARVRRLVDKGDIAKDANSADNTSIYYFDNFPCALSSVIIDTKVYVAGILKTEITHYTLDRNIGELTWTAGNVPASGIALKIIYKYYNYTDDTIWSYITSGGTDKLKIYDDESAFTYSSITDLLTPTPTELEEYCIALATAIDIVSSDENKSISEGIEVKEGDTSINTAHGGDRTKSVERWEKSLKEVISAKKMNSAIVGDRVPLYTWDILQEDQWDE